MKLFGQIIRTVVNVATLPVKLPVAIVKDSLDFMDAKTPRNTSKLIEQIKDDAKED